MIVVTICGFTPIKKNGGRILEDEKQELRGIDTSVEKKRACVGAWPG
jgi:hypothetical protein